MALATSVGTHALPVFGALLCVLLLAAWACWHVMHLHSRRAIADASQPAEPRFVLLNVAIGFAVVIGGAAGFAEIAEQLAPDGAMALADEALTVAIRTHVSLPTLQVFAALTHFGDVAVLTALGIVVTLWLWWKRRRALALAWVLAVGGNALLNPMLKGIFERVRPVHEHGLVTELGWSFPSGHASSSTVAYGMLAYLAVRLLPVAWHLPAVLAAAALAFTVGCSRVFLQVHFASDVAAGFASGGAWLAVCIVSTEWSRLRRRP